MKKILLVEYLRKAGFKVFSEDDLDEACKYFDSIEE